MLKYIKIENQSPHVHVQTITRITLRLQTSYFFRAVGLSFISWVTKVGNGVRKRGVKLSGFIYDKGKNIGTHGLQ